MDSSQEQEEEDEIPPVIDLLGGPEAELPTIWDDDKVCKITDKQGKRRWKCKWCYNDFATWNATKAIAHVSRTKGRDVKLCNGQIDEAHKKVYSKLAARMLKKRERSYKRHADVNRSIE
jgi:Zn-finger protein